MHSENGKHVECEGRSKQFIEFFTLVSATPRQDKDTVNRKRRLLNSNMQARVANQQVLSEFTRFSASFYWQGKLKQRIGFQIF